MTDYASGDWRDDGQAANHHRQEEVRRDIEEVLVKVIPYLNHDEMALLNWATGMQRKESKYE